MSGGIAWFVRNPVAANLLMAFLAVAGLAASTVLRREAFPEIMLDLVAVEVPYLGAAPEEVESGVVLRIEEAIQGIDGIREIRSTAAEGRASVIAAVEFGVDVRRVLDDVKNSVDALTTLPLETEKPIIRELIARNQVVDVVVSGATDVFVLKALAERVRDELTGLPEITQAELVGAPPYEISIEVSEAALRRHGMTFDQVANAVRRSSLDLPGGGVRTSGGEVLLRTVGQAYRGDEYERLVLWTRADGSRLRLGDVATVVDGFAETDLHARFDRDPAVMVSVFRTGEQSVIDVADAVTRWVGQAQARMPEGIALTVWRNEADVLDQRLSIMLRSAAGGFLLVFVLLALFCDLRLALWVAVGIVVAFLGAIAMMPILDVSLSLVSIFAFVLVLGIVVDDSIVLGENILRHQRAGGDALAGAVAGAREMSKPVVFAVLTTVVAFLPLLAVPGITGQVFAAIPLIAIPCLLVSLVESLGILPAHLAHGRRRGAGRRSGLPRWFGGGLEWLARRVYEPLLDVALRWRYATLAAGLGMLLLSAAAVAGGQAGFEYFPSVEPNHVTASITLPPGTPVEATSAAVARIEQGAARVRERILRETGRDYFRHVATTIGDQPLRARDGGPIGPVVNVAAANVGEVTVELAPAETRAWSSEQLGALWREATGPVPDAVEVSYATSVVNVGGDINVRLTGPDLDRLSAAADALKRRLAEQAGVFEIADSFRAGKQELRLGIRPEAETLGLSLQDLGRQVRQAFYGEEAQRIQRGRDDVRVMVRYPRDARRSVGDLENMRVRTRDGGEVPFGLVAELETGRGYATISRIDRNRAVEVTARVDPAVSAASAVVADLRQRILPELLAEYPGVRHAFGGAQAEQADTVASLLNGYVLALLLIFALMAVPLRSYVQPLIILCAVPFGVVGAIWGHVVMGVALTMTSLLGVVALTGVVVNDSLVMIDFINRARDGQAGGGLAQAIREAGSKRFRAIVLTSLTTFAGLLPLMLDRSREAMFLIPMAISLAYGVLFATFVTLLLVPTACLILDDVQRAGRRLLGGWRQRPV